MKEQRFSYFCDGKHDRYCTAIGPAKPDLSTLIEQFKAKEVNMKGENLWNKPTHEQAQILSLAAMIQGGNKNSNDSSKNKNGSKNKSGSSDNASEPTLKKKDRRVKPWMLVTPKEGESTSMMKNNKDYHWCPKCAKGAGQWVRHKPKDHSNDFKPKKKATETNGASSESSKKKGKKDSNTGGNGSTGDGNASGSNGNSLCFNQAALLSVAAGNEANIQVFLSQFVLGKE